MLIYLKKHAIFPNIVSRCRRSTLFPKTEYLPEKCHFCKGTSCLLPTYPPTTLYIIRMEKKYKQEASVMRKVYVDVDVDVDVHWKRISGFWR
jgi:predicted nucleic acid binding AN1-type Zn finger protein